MKTVLFDEIFDSLEILLPKIKTLVEFVKTSKNPVFFTGAGISTFAGIPDYRSSFKTTLKTGPGLWESEENRLKYTGNTIIKPAIECYPTKTHMAIKTLLRKQLISHVITQNVDNLHLRSGISEENLIELHGNICKEFCEKCEKMFYRDYYVKNPKTTDSSEIYTLRHCPYCSSQLRKTLVNFGEKIPKEKLLKAYKWIHESDLCVCLGSSLKVNPASKIPKEFLQNKNKKLAIINLQPTMYEKMAHINLYGYCDDIMSLFMKQLNIEIDPFKIRKILIFNFSMEEESLRMKIEGKIPDDPTKEFFNIQEIEVSGIENQECFKKKDEEFYEFLLMKNILNFKVCIKFYGNLLEPNAEISFNLKSKKMEMGAKFGYELILDEFLKIWEIKEFEAN